MKIKLFTIFIFTLLLATSVNAFGVASFYYEGKPLILNPGSTQDVQLILQKEPTTAPVSVKAEIVTGADIAAITGKTAYYVAGNTPVVLTIVIPETAQIGDEYSVGVQFTTQGDPKGKMLELGTQINSEIPIVIGRVIEPKKSLVELLHLEKLGPIALILVLIIIVMFLIHKLKKHPKKK